MSSMAEVDLLMHRLWSWAFGLPGYDKKAWLDLERGIWSLKEPASGSGPKVGPIKPSEVSAKKIESLPAKVFQVFNRLIGESWNGYSATVMQGVAADMVAEALRLTRGEVFDRHLLDVEDAYREAGWYVEYDKPGYNESYEASFRFTRAKVSP